jgi:choline dehydrogenase-like flavoprotein
MSYKIPLESVWHNVKTPDDIKKPREIKVDVVVIGSGAGGGVVAKELSQAGLSVAILEEGKYLTAKDYADVMPLEALRMLYRRGGITFTQGNQAIILPQGLCVGGSTVVNSGTTLRALPEAIERWENEYGLSEFVKKIDFYYSRCEEFLNVCPVDEQYLSSNDRIFERGAQLLKYQGAILKRNQRGCTGLGRCVFGCPSDAKQSTNVSYIPLALNYGATIYTQCPAVKILTAHKQVKGVIAEVQKEEGRAIPLKFYAKYVVLAAGALFTPYLLKTARGIKGKGIGRNLIIHPASRVVGIFDEEVYGWRGVPQGYHLTEFLTSGISIEGIFLPPSLMGTVLPVFGKRLLETMKQFNYMAMLGYRIIEDESKGSLLFGLTDWPFIWYWLKKSDVEKIKRATVIASEILFSAGAKKVYTAVRNFEEIKTSSELKRLHDTKISATDVELSAYHAQATAKAGHSPSLSAVDQRGEVWGVKNLYVADASILPSPPLSNPQLSIQAFATYISENILRDCGQKLTET